VFYLSVPAIPVIVNKALLLRYHKIFNDKFERTVFYPKTEKFKFISLSVIIWIVFTQKKLPKKDQKKKNEFKREQTLRNTTPAPFGKLTIVTQPFK
jgi:hypothetical protein